MRMFLPPRIIAQLALSFERGRMVVYQGKFHWKADGCVIAYDPDPLNQPTKCNLIPMPKQAQQQRYRRLQLSQGCLRIVTHHDLQVYFVYEITDYNNKKWCLKYHVDMSHYFHDQVDIFDFHCSPINGDTAFLIFRYLDGKEDITEKLAFINFNTTSISSVMELPQNSAVRSFLYVMTSWPTIFPQLISSFNHEKQRFFYNENPYSANTG